MFKTDTFIWLTSLHWKKAVLHYSLAIPYFPVHDIAMEQIKTNPILKFNVNQLQNVRKALGYEDVNKLKQDIEHLTDWIKMQNHFRVKEFGKR